MLSPKKDVLSGQTPQGVFFCSEPNEKLIRSLRVTCKLAEGGAPKSRTKFVNGLAKSGYWLPGVAWDTSIIEQALTSVVTDSNLPHMSTEVPFQALKTSAMCMAVRYASGQVVLGNDIQRRAWQDNADVDGRDAILG